MSVADSPRPPSPSLLRALPGVGRLLDSGDLAPLIDAHGRPAVTRATQRALGELRGEIESGAAGDTDLAAEALRRRIERALTEEARPFYQRVINATGVVLHTNLGRAPLAPEAVTALAAAAGAQRLEVDLESGERGGRDRGCAELLVELTGAEAATVVNNNAAATLLVLAALARGRRVVLSRGEMVEIGGSYRVPEILRESGAELVEVGTTNRTHHADYRAALEAVGDAGEPGLLLKVHTSNYRIEGFTAEVEIEELVALGRERGVPVVHDLGSGCLVDLAARGLPAEPLVQRSVAAGADAVCFSGDKLLGGPQAGVLVGRREAIERCRRHPLYRAMRPGRLVYGALEATLRLYRDGAEAALAAVPALSRLTASPDELAARAARLAAALAELPGVTAEPVACTSQAGSGSIPARDLPSRGVRLALAGRTADELAAVLRRGDPPVVARVQDGAVLLDVRTLDDGEVEELTAAVAALAG